MHVVCLERVDDADAETLPGILRLVQMLGGLHPHIGIHVEYKLHILLANRNCCRNG